MGKIRKNHTKITKALALLWLWILIPSAFADHAQCWLEATRESIRASFEPSNQFPFSSGGQHCSGRLCQDLDTLHSQPWTLLSDADAQNISRNYVYLHDLLEHTLEPPLREQRLDLLRRLFLRNPDLFYQRDLPRELSGLATGNTPNAENLSYLGRLGFDLAAPNRRFTPVRNLLEGLIGSRYLDTATDAVAMAQARRVAQQELSAALSATSPRAIQAKVDLFRRNHGDAGQLEAYQTAVSSQPGTQAAAARPARAPLRSLAVPTPEVPPAPLRAPLPAALPLPLHVPEAWRLARRPNAETPWVVASGQRAHDVPDEARLILAGAERTFRADIPVSLRNTGYRLREHTYQGSAGGNFVVVRRIHAPSNDTRVFSREQPMVTGAAYLYNPTLGRMEALPRYRQDHMPLPWNPNGRGINHTSPSRIVYRVLNEHDASRLRANPGMALRAAGPGNNAITPHIHVSRANGYEVSPYISTTRDLDTAMQWASSVSCHGCLVVAIDLSRLPESFQNNTNIIDLTNQSTLHQNVQGTMPRNWAGRSAEVLIHDSQPGQPAVPANAYDIVFDTMLPQTSLLNVTREEMLGERSRPR